MSGGLFDDLVAALPSGIHPGSDTRGYVVTDLLDWDDDSSRGLAAVDSGDSTWLLASADCYWPDVIGNPVIVARNVWTGKAMYIAGPLGSYPYPDPELEEMPGKGTVTSVPGVGRVVVSAGGESYTARTVLSYASPSSGDVVALVWDGGSPIAVGELGAWTPSAPSEPSNPSLSRSGGTVTVSWSKPASVDTTGVQYRNAGGSWSYKSGLKGTSTTISIGQGKTREVRIRQANAGGTSGWSDISTIRRAGAPAPSKPPAPKYKTVTTTVTPTYSGTYRVSSTWNRWNGNKYGGFSTLYQGSQYGSGDLIGLATYGSRVRDLRAVEILKIEVRLVDANPGVHSPGQPIRLQVSPHGSRPGGAPTSIGSVKGATLGKGASRWFNLDLAGSTLDDFRTGQLAGITIRGGPYRAIRGRGTSGMTLRVTYRRRV